VSNCSCITVDFWAKTDRNVLAAFLTHAHADHVQGLNDSWSGKIAPWQLVLPCALSLQGWMSNS
jgi:mRNA degradation ribonuclease J1/J2